MGNAVVLPAPLAGKDGDDDVTPAMHALSWGNVGEYRRLVCAQEEVTSMYSSGLVLTIMMKPLIWTLLLLAQEALLLALFHLL